MKIEDLSFALPNATINEKDFNLERWRQENPMDYFKALYLVLSSPSQIKGLPKVEAMNESFLAIYRVTRLYIPNVLYKYYSLTDDCSLNEKKFTTLKNKKIFMSDIKDFNDPFDGKAFFYNPNELKEIKYLVPYNGQLIDDFSTYIKGAALTENDENCMPMWAHYANNHRGFCVAYDMKDPNNNVLYSCTFPIQYTAERVDITSFIKEYAEMIEAEVDKQTAQGEKVVKIKDISLIYTAQFLYNVKQFTWRYEKEFRCTIGATAPEMPYINAVPKTIYIGMNCSQDNKRKLLDIAKSLSIPIYQMNFDNFSENYSLEKTLYRQ